MPRYILIDNYTGYIWGDTGDLDGPARDETPLEAARRLDEHVGGEPREYEQHGANYRPDANVGAYHVYRADIGGSDAVRLVTDGQSQEEIDAVERDCRKVAVVTWEQMEN
jgi:hypothetical protein